MPYLEFPVSAKTDPIEYRFTYEWLFRIMAEEGIHYVQLGTFSELHHLPNDFFITLRQLAEGYQISIASVFTAHRELGRFFRDAHPAWEGVARRNYERLIEVGALVGAQSVGSNPGAVVRDRLDFQDEGVQRGVRCMKELMGYAHKLAAPCLTIEPMSCLAEPPILPDGMHNPAHADQ